MNADFSAGPAPDDPAQRLKTALDEVLTGIFKALQEQRPDLDPVSFASLMIDYGVELAETSGLVSSSLMADYLRALAEAIETDAVVWPILCVQSQSSSIDAPF